MSFFGKLILVSLLPIILSTQLNGVSGKISYVDDVSVTRNKKRINSVVGAAKYKGDKEHSYLEPLFDDEDSNLENEITLFTADAKKDSYENNNSFNSATELSPSFDGNNIAEDYHKTIYATLHRNEWLWGLWKREIDEDYYAIKVYGKAILSIALEDIPIGCDYDLEFYSFDNEKNCDEKSISQISQSSVASNGSEQIIKDILPNVYFIRVYSYTGFNAQQNYNLQINVDYDFKTEDIADMRYSKGIGAAVWVSDYDPFGMLPFARHSTEEVGYEAALGTKYLNYFAHPFAESLLKKGDILHASLYIWDMNLRRALYELVRQTANKLETTFSKNESMRLSFDVISQNFNNVFTVLSVGVSLISLVASGQIITTTLSLISLGLTVAPPLLSSILDFLMPNSLVESGKNYLNYLNVLAVALECNVHTDNNEVVRIDSKYRIEAQKVPLISQTNYIIDFSPFIQESYLYDKDTIQAYQDNAYFNGTVYPIRELDDIHRIRIKNQSIIGEVNTGGNTRLVLNQSIPASLNEGEYRWYNFTAPENATYLFHTSGTTDTVGELFYDIVPGRQTQGRICYNDDKENYDDDDYNFSITHKLYKGHTIYIRVHGYNWYNNGLFAIRAEKLSDLVMTTERIDKASLYYRGEYVDSPESTGVILDSGFHLSTERLRCGYILNKYLTLSAKTKDAGLAYLTLSFPVPIQSFNFDMAIWGENEGLNTQSSILLEIKDRLGIWKNLHIFEISMLPKNKDTLASFSFDFSTDVYGIRLKVTTNSVTSTSNRGRVVLDNIALTY